MPAGGAAARRPHPDLFVGIAVVVLAAIVYAATFTFDEAPFEMSGGMGAEAFPRLVLGIIAVLGAALAWRARRRLPEALEPVPPMVLYTALLLAGFMLANALMGMLVAMGIVVVALGVLWGDRKIVALSFLGFVMCAAIWAVFVLGLAVPLPGGMLGRLFS
jgi:putative tricarboxylic transport membrane protein